MTAIPALIDIGPALIAFFPEVIEYPTPTSISFSKNTVFVDAPPTGAPAGRFDKLEPSPEKDIAVSTPVTIAPEFVVTNFALLLKFNVCPPPEENTADVLLLAKFVISNVPDLNLKFPVPASSI